MLKCSCTGTIHELIVVVLPASAVGSALQMMLTLLHAPRFGSDSLVPYYLLDALSKVVGFGKGIEYLHGYIIWVGILATIRYQVPYLFMRPLLDGLPLGHQPGVIFRSHIHDTVPTPSMHVSIQVLTKKATTGVPAKSHIWAVLQLRCKVDIRQEELLGNTK